MLIPEKSQAPVKLTSKNGVATIDKRCSAVYLNSAGSSMAVEVSKAKKKKLLNIFSKDKGVKLKSGTDKPNFKIKLSTKGYFKLRKLKFKLAKEDPAGTSINISVLKGNTVRSTQVCICKSTWLFSHDPNVITQ